MTLKEIILISACLIMIPCVVLLGQREKKTKAITTSIEVIDSFPSQKLLLALRTIESSLRADAISKCGARGLYQIMPLTWSDHSSEPFSKAFDPQINTTVAVTYLIWIRNTLSLWEEQEEESISLDHILSCWHGGIGRFQKRGYSPGMMPDSTKEFVNQVTTLLGDQP